MRDGMINSNNEITKIKAQEIIDKLYELSSQGQVKACTFLFFKIETELEQERVQIIDELLGIYDPKKTESRLISVGLMRGTFRVKDICTNYNSCLTRIIDWLDLHEYDTQKVLRGLI